MDLPFAQKCWCGSAGIDQIITLSDHFEASFGTAYGSTYKRTSFIDRAIFIVDRQSTIKYLQMVN